MIDLYDMLGLGEADGPGADPFGPEQGGQTAPAGHANANAIECDRWAVRRGADLLKGHPELTIEPAAAADFSAAAFECKPRLFDGCVDMDRHRFLAELLDTEAYRASHAHTALNEQAAEMAAAEYASAFAALKANHPAGLPDDRDGDRAVSHAAKQAAEAANEEVEGMVQTCNGLGLTPGGDMQRVDPHAAARVYKRVKNSHRLRKIMEMAGRFRRLAQSKQRLREVHGLGEVVDLTLGGEIERMVPAELARFAIPGTVLDEYRRVLQRQAMVREHRNPVPAGRGPIVCCVDECLHPDTLIPLADGRIVPIQEVKPGDVAFSVDFQNGRVIAQRVGRVAQVESPKELLSVKTPEGFIRVSDTHRFFVLRNGHVHEVRAGDLRKGDRVAAPARVPVQPINVTGGSERWAEAIGGMLGDGNAWKDKAGNARVVFYEMDRDHMARHRAFWESFGFRPKVKPKGVSQAMFINSRVLHTLLTGPEYAGLLLKQPKRSVPVMIQQWPHDMRRAFLRGLFDAEGSVGDHQITITMSSKTVVLQVQAMLRRDGIISEYDRQWSEKGAKWYPRLIIGDRVSLERFEALIGFAIGVKKTALRELIGEPRLPRRGRRLMVPVPPDSVSALMKDAAFRIGRGGRGQIVTQERTFGCLSRYKLSDLLDGITKKIDDIEEAITVTVPADMIRKAGISRDVIAKATGLSDSQVQKLQNGVSRKAANIALVRKFYGRRVKELRAEVLRLRAVNSDDLYWTPVRSITRTPSKVTHLYDLTMDGPNANYLTVNCVVHNSGSMRGGKIEAAKGLALAMAWLAREQGRWCALQSFGGDRTTHGVLLPPGRWDEEALLGWLERFMRDSATTLDVLCHTVPFELWDTYVASGMTRGKTDVVLITDGIVAPPDNLPAFLAWKAREKARVLAIVVEAGSTHGGVEAVSDEAHAVRNLSADSSGAAAAVSIG